ncbi:MAG: Tll0287-like domain-containing protein [Nitrospiraceae bacterium]
MSEKEMLMKSRVFIFTPLSLMFFLIWSSIGWAQAPREETEKTAQLLATLLNVGRLIVERNQTLIDDPRRGDKGFTPEVFERQVLDEFIRQTNIDLKHPSSDFPALAKELLPVLLQSSKAVVADAQLVINQRGIGYKNFIPATFGSQAARKFSNRSHVKIKQTTLNPRNPKNAPDAYEENVLKRLATQPVSKSPIIEWIDNEKTLRALTPIYYSHNCLVCHGNPRGFLDVSGYPREGAQEGDLAGAISIQIPMNSR